MTRHAARARGLQRRSASGRQARRPVPWDVGHPAELAAASAQALHRLHDASSMRCNTSRTRAAVGPVRGWRRLVMYVAGISICNMDAVVGPAIVARDVAALEAPVPRACSRWPSAPPRRHLHLGRARAAVGAARFRSVRRPSKSAAARSRSSAHPTAPPPWAVRFAPARLQCRVVRHQYCAAARRLALSVPRPTRTGLLAERVDRHQPGGVWPGYGLCPPGRFRSIRSANGAARACGAHRRREVVEPRQVPVGVGARAAPPASCAARYSAGCRCRRAGTTPGAESFRGSACRVRSRA